MNGMMTGVDTSASSFSLGCLDVSVTSSPKRFEWVKMNLDTRAAMNKFSLNFGPASGEWIPDGGAWQFQGYDENGLLRSLNGRLTDSMVYTKCCAVLQKSRAKDDKISTSDMTVDT